MAVTKSDKNICLQHTAVIYMLSKRKGVGSGFLEGNRTDPCPGNWGRGLRAARGTLAAVPEVVVVLITVWHRLGIPQEGWTAGSSVPEGLGMGGPVLAESSRAQGGTGPRHLLAAPGDGSGPWP